MEGGAATVLAATRRASQIPGRNVEPLPPPGSSHPEHASLPILMAPRGIQGHPSQFGSSMTVTMR